MDVAGRTAIVSGGASGIGRAIVLALLDKGARVVISDLDESGAQETIALRPGSTEAAFQRCDVTKSEDLLACFDFAKERFGLPTIVCNNAGIAGGDFLSDDAGAWKRVVEIDLTAVIDATRIAVVGLQRANEPGAIVNTASLIGLGPFSEAPVYAAAKAGVVNFTRSLAHLAQDGIRVNAICPELVDTPMASELGEETLAALRASDGILRPEAIAAGVLELIEDETRAGAILQITTARGAEYIGAGS